MPPAVTSIAVLGAGAWGTALAHALVAYHPQQPHVMLWARDANLIEQIQRTRYNPRYLAEIELHPRLQATTNLQSALTQSHLVIIASAVAGLRPICQQLAQLAQPLPPLLWLCKGLEAETDCLPHQIIQQTFGSIPCAALSGPSFALEVAHGQPAALTLASHSPELLRWTQPILHGGNLRIYTSTDVVGVEIGGAVKNVLAIATGICDGLQLGLNARAALITRGLAEMARLAVALGGQAETMMGLAGLGDLLLTTTGDLSRNRRVGLLLAQGLGLKNCLAQLGHVAEGVYCAPSVLKIATQHQVVMPLVEMVNAVLFQGVAAAQAVQSLLAREAGSEL